jgi:hypothetical protein
MWLLIEIRNRVYDFAIAEENSAFTALMNLPKYFERRRPQLVLHPLRHVSCQIRHEFRFLDRPGPIRLYPCDLNPYIKTVYPSYTEKGPVNLSGYRGIILLDLRPKEYPKAFDMLPVIRLAKASPNFHFRMVGRSEDPRCDFCFREMKMSIFSNNALVQQAWDHLLLGRIKMIHVDLVVQELRISVAAGLRDLMFWPGSHDLFDGDTIAERLGLGNWEDWLVQIVPHRGLYHDDVGWCPHRAEEDWFHERFVGNLGGGIRRNEISWDMEEGAEEEDDDNDEEEDTNDENNEDSADDEDSEDDDEEEEEEQEKDDD